ncbi:MAG: ankyrin repeat domain-containing protein [Acidobacteriota bacterium]
MTRDWEKAVFQGDVDAVERLAAGGADVNARDVHGQTGLMLAAMRGHMPIVRLLIDRGADLNHTSKYHLSALMLAVINGHAAIARALVEAGADRSIRGTGAPGFHGLTAADLASARGEEGLADLLRKEGKA